MGECFADELKRRGFAVIGAVAGDEDPGGDPVEEDRRARLLGVVHADRRIAERTKIEGEGGWRVVGGMGGHGASLRPSKVVFG